MTSKNLSGLARQDAFIKSIQGQEFDFGLVMTQAFLKGIRDIGYKSTAHALFESIDNSIQAEAGNIHVIFDIDKKSGPLPNRIAIVDDGYGMSKEMIRIAVLWGGTDRLDDRQGMGKYGYGLPSSCVSIGKRFTVISKREDMNDWCSVTIDIEEIANHNPEYIDQNTGRIVAPDAKIANIPEFIKNHLKKFPEFNDLSHGTIILIDTIDRLSMSSFKPLKKFLSLETGITYRNYLRSTNIYIDGEIVEPVDPLFTTEGYRYYDENDLRAEALPSLEFKVPNSSDKSKEGQIKIRYSSLPYGFFNGSENRENVSTDATEEHDGGRTKSKRLTVRKHNNGIIFLRKGRQIDVVDSRCPWTRFQNNDRYIGVEIDFTPELDEEFSITTAKQQIVVSERMWNVLRDNGVYEAINQLRKRYHKQSMEDKHAKENEIHAIPQKRDDFVETMMKESAHDFELDKESLPPHVRKEGEENLEKQAKKKSKETGVPENLIKQKLEADAENKPYKLSYFDEEEGPFYRAEQVGGQVSILINKAHRFYTDLFNNPRTDAFMKNALGLIVFVLGHSELRVTDEKRKWYRVERNAWSLKLETTLETLSKYFDKSTDDKMAEEEMIDSEIENSNN